jgi:hypothetical protein
MNLMQEVRYNIESFQIVSILDISLFKSLKNMLLNVWLSQKNRIKVLGQQVLLSMLIL